MRQAPRRRSLFPPGKPDRLYELKISISPISGPHEDALPGSGSGGSIGHRGGRRRS
jgi:hypothetical protein